MWFKQRKLKKLLAADQNLLLTSGLHHIAASELAEEMEKGSHKTFTISHKHEMILMDGARPLVNIHGFRHLDLNPINGMTFVFRLADDIHGPVKYFEVKEGHAFELLQDIIPIITFHDTDPKMRMADLGQQTLPVVHAERKF